MQLDEQIQQHIVTLPVDLKAEVLDFVLFLEQKQAKQGVIYPNQEQQQLFVDSLSGSTESNDKLKRSVKAYKEQMGL